MQKTIFILYLCLLGNFCYGQNKMDAEILVDEGIAYHDKGDYDGAISRYDKALELDKDNLLAMTEKAFSLLSLQKYDESISYCQKAIAIYPGSKGLKTVYVTYGNALDALKKTDKSIEIYDEGIRQFPEYYQLYFNKGVSLSSVRKFDDALLCFQKSVSCDPDHASSHNAIARLSHVSDKRIPALLAYCRFLAIEPQTKRSRENLASLQKMMNGNVEKTGKKSVTINISSDMLDDTAANGKPLENRFSSTDLILSMDAALDYDKKNRNKTEVEQFLRKFETVCSSLRETRKDNYGFFWDYYVPYFTEMKDKKLIEAFSYIVFASSDDPAVLKWLKSHTKETSEFFEWSKSFNWKTN